MNSVDNERPPIIAFSREPVEDRNASVQAGRYVAKDVDFVTVTRPGSRDNVVEEVSTYLSKLQQRARGGQIPAEWPEKFEAAYERWKKGEDLPDSGTPIKTWAVLSPAAQEMLIRMGVRTVEDLAELPEPELQKMGMGIHSYREKARDWIRSASEVGTVVEEINGLRLKYEEALKTMQDLIDENKRLRELVKGEGAPLPAKKKELI